MVLDPYRITLIFPHDSMNTTASFSFMTPESTAIPQVESDLAGKDKYMPFYSHHILSFYFTTRLRSLDSSRVKRTSALYYLRRHGLWTNLY